MDHILLIYIYARDYIDESTVNYIPIDRVRMH